MKQPIVIAAILAAVGAILLLWFLYRLMGRLRSRAEVAPEGKKPKKIPRAVSYWAILAAVICLTLSWSLFCTASLFNGFRPFGPPGRVGQVDVRNTGDNVKSMMLEYCPLGDSSSQPTSSFYLSGNSWRVKGQVVKFGGVLATVFGQPHLYKVSGFEGDYIGHKPPGVTAAILTWQEIEGGELEAEEYLATFKFLDKLLQVGRFESDFATADNASYWMILSDSGRVRLEPKVLAAAQAIEKQ